MNIFFWRWGTWKVFDAHSNSPMGVVAFITTSAYIAGQAFIGMRRYLRERADEGWIIDLSPEHHQAQAATRVFPGVQQPICIGVFVRKAQPDHDRAARIRYVALAGRQATKFRQLRVLGVDDSRWSECPTGWTDPFLPPGSDVWQRCPLLGDLFPWHTVGIMPKRTWVYAIRPSVLRKRWTQLLAAPTREKAILLRESRGGRNIESRLRPMDGLRGHDVPLSAESDPEVLTVRVGFRSFDVQWLLADQRVIDRPCPVLWSVTGDNQVFITELHTEPIVAGPGLTFSAYMPDTHHYQGHGGGRVIPLFRDRDGAVANVAPTLVNYLSSLLGTSVSVHDVVAYVAGIVAHPAYTERFRQDLVTPGVRVPLTKDPLLWSATVAVGREVLWLHTSGQRYSDTGDGRPFGPPRMLSDDRPKVRAPIPHTPEGMPTTLRYDATTQTLQVGRGQIAPVPPAAFQYRVSGMQVVTTWFSYRKKNPEVRWSSALNGIHIDAWDAGVTEELLDLLNVLGRLVQLESRQKLLLDQVLGGPQITVTDLTAAGVFPIPQSARQRPPLARISRREQLALGAATGEFLQGS